MNKTALEEYKQAVEAQAQELLDVVQLLARGDLGVQVPVPPTGEGVEILAELAAGLEMMVGDLRHLPLVDEGGTAVGIISSRDVVRYLSELVNVD